jgi:hypothetical protein
MPATTVIQFIRPRGIYEAGFSGSVTVPDGVTCFQAWVQGAGGGGRERADVAGSGGGGGGFVYFYSDVLEAEWGTSLTLSVGGGALETDGDPSTLTGTLNGTAFTLTANGGESGKPSRDGVGGTASGGTTNISGSDGTGYVAAPIDERAPGFGGAAGGDGQDLIEGGYGAGSSGSQPFPAGVLSPGEDGYIAIEWG